MINITLRYGVDQHPVSVSEGATIDSVLGSDTNKAILGYGDNVKALVNGVEQSSSAQLFDGAEVVIETKANSKAVPAVA